MWLQRSESSKVDSKPICQPKRRLLKRRRKIKQEEEKVEQATGSVETSAETSGPSSSDKKYPEREPLKVDERIEGRVVEPISFDNFWLTVADHSGFELVPSLINDHMASENISATNDITSGKTCLVRTEAKDSGDTPAFQRGRITGVEEGGQSCDVLLIDYGQLLRSYPASHVYDIPNEFVAWIPQAIKCSLHGVDAEWLNDEAKTKLFVDLVKGKEVAAIVKATEESAVEVEILLDGEDVRKMVLAVGDDTDVAKQIEDELADVKDSEQAEEGEKAE